MRQNYFRALRIIASCKKREHITGAKRYVELLLQKYSTRKGDYYEASDEVWMLYESLIDVLNRKKAMIY